MTSRFKAVLFDGGNTLMYGRAEWPPVLQEADRALARALAQYGIALEANRFRQRLKEYYARRDQDLHETTYHLVLRDLLTELGHTDVTEAQLRLALDALFRITQANWSLEAEAIPTLQALQADGYRLGLVSNAGDDQDVRQLVRRFGLEALLDFVLTSAACSYRKPHARIFEIALSHWFIPPEQAVMVGDTLAADILGAKALGMYSIWFTRHALRNAEEEARIRPDASIASLAEIPGHLRGLQ
jgi:HAD superfamily hydrolase (TIGR01662 family)